MAASIGLCCFSFANVVYVLSFAALLILFRAIYLIIKVHQDLPLASCDIRTTNTKTMIIAGSGGHTTEMIRLLTPLKLHFTPRIYIVAKTDTMSEEKIHTMEKLKNDESMKNYYRIVKIPRSREVHQSYFTSVITTLYSLIHCVMIIFHYCPDLVICNGPGTCIPICASAFLLKCLGFKDVKIIFVESICRVKTLSLSGKILYIFADSILVQWPELLNEYPRAKYLGRLV